MGWLFSHQTKEDLLRELLAQPVPSHAAPRCWHTQSPAMNFGLS